MIQFAITNARDLKSYRHMGKYKFAAIRLGTYNDFVQDVTALVDRIRKWYIDNTVSFLSKSFSNSINRRLNVFLNYSGY